MRWRNGSGESIVVEGSVGGLEIVSRTGLASVLLESGGEALESNYRTGQTMV